MSLRKAFLEEVTFALSLEGTPKTWCSAGERQEEEKAFRAECGALGIPSCSDGQGSSIFWKTQELDVGVKGAVRVQGSAKHGVTLL